MVVTIGNLSPLDAELKEQFQQLFRAVCTENLNPNVMVMKSAKDGV